MLNVALAELVMANFSEYFEISPDQVESIFDVLEKDRLGKVAFSEIEKMLNTLINKDDSFSDHSRGSQGNGKPMQPTLNESLELDPEEAVKYQDSICTTPIRDSTAQKSIGGKSRIYESIVDIDIDWNNFQELKLILFSINFNGNEKLRFEELEKRKLG